MVDHYMLPVNEKRNTIISLLYTIMSKSLGRDGFIEACADYGVTKTDVLDFLKETAAKEHALGWCKDPRCPENSR